MSIGVDIVRFVFDDILTDELKRYLLTQEGIKGINILVNHFISEIDIKFEQKITPKIIKGYIYLFQKNEFPVMLEFDKGTKDNYKQLKYVIDDMCCEYCYKGLIEDLFDNDYIISVKSNFDFYKPAFNIELFIRYSEDYNEKELIQYIKDRL